MFELTFWFPQWLRRNLIMLLTVKKTVLQPHQCRNSWKTIWRRARTAAGSVEETVTRCLLFRFTCESIQERNLTNALYVGSSSPRKVSLKVTKRFTQERNHSLVQTAGKTSLTRVPWTDTGSHTQERGPTTAPCVTGASTSQAAWGNMRKSTLGRSLTVQSVTRVLHEPQASRTISGFTLERGRMAATSAGEASAAHKAWGSTDGNMNRFRLWRSPLSMWRTMIYRRATTTLRLICV